MRQHYRTSSPISGATPECDFILDKNGFRIETDSYRDADYFVTDFLCRNINMDHWQHSWHMDIANAKCKGSDERKKAAAILKDKITDREADIKQLRNALVILGRWKYGLRTQKSKFNNAR